ncbi:hypothetical protein Ssi03_74290 [Sphaerisporangium siamense]|uniref:Uncharacterized protein n=1 Tax=Sphaerisporangium siamense TaxID=795645 RepID=A0A7W7GAZ8_9ACTN|nr:hypothetical protein [Sphaerisporangium siamense]GII89439.1 hypothetical protein Ssi03_74290 [Sphaerisporangium siamense]
MNPSEQSPRPRSRNPCPRTVKDDDNELPRPLLVGRDADRVFNELYRSWALEYNVDPDEDPEFLRASRVATGHDPETGLPAGTP